MPEKLLGRGRLAVNPPAKLTVPAPRSHTARFVLDPDALELIYPAAIREQIESRVQVLGDPLTSDQLAQDSSLLSGVSMLFSGWGAPRLTESLLESASDLKVVFYGAGDTRGFFTDAARQRGIQVTSCNAANAVPVAEYTLAQVIMCLKRVWQNHLQVKNTRSWTRDGVGATCYGSTVGIVSLGDIGRLVVEHLSRMDINVFVYDIHQDEQLASKYGFTYVGLDQIFSECDVVSLHTPLLPQTTGMIDKTLLESMKPEASLINTARGAIINQPHLIEVLRDRPDLLAILDVVYPEPPSDDCPIWDVPNAILTPHIAGSLGQECQRMGKWVLDDLDRYLNKMPMRGEVP